MEHESGAYTVAPGDLRSAISASRQFVHVYLLNDDDGYPDAPEIYLADAIVPCAVLEGLKIDLSRVFV